MHGPVATNILDLYSCSLAGGFSWLLSVRAARSADADGRRSPRTADTLQEA